MDDIEFLKIARKAIEVARRRIAAEANINRLISQTYRLPAQQAAIDEHDSLLEADAYAAAWAARIKKESKHGADGSRPTSRRD